MSGLPTTTRVSVPDLKSSPISHKRAHNSCEASAVSVVFFAIASIFNHLRPQTRTMISISMTTKLKQTPELLQIHIYKRLRLFLNKYRCAVPKTIKLLGCVMFTSGLLKLSQDAWKNKNNNTYIQLKYFFTSQNNFFSLNKTTLQVP